MPRPADPKAKTLRLVLKAKPGQEEKIRGFKEICLRNGFEIGDILFKYGVENFLKEHHWPPGQSQTQLDYAGKPKMLPLYKTCKFSGKQLVKGTFICNYRNRSTQPYWKIPKACDRCKHYEAEK